MFAEGFSQNLWHIPISLKTNLKTSYLPRRLSLREAKCECEEGGAAVMLGGLVVYPMNTTDVEWVKANVEQSGFYRVLYDQKHWIALAKQFMRDHTVTLTNRKRRSSVAEL